MSLVNPQPDPPESVLMVIADYGDDGGGWGPAAIPGLGPFIYTAKSEQVEEAAKSLAEAVARGGIEARVVRFTHREDIQISRARKEGTNGD